jgi:hypothetical protein
MATQYTAGLSVGQVLTAATMNSIGAAWETWTPTLTQTATVTKTTNYAKYMRIQKLVIAQCYMTVTGAGTGGTNVVVGLPITALELQSQIVGGGFIYDSSANMVYHVVNQITSTTTMSFYTDQNGSGNFFGTNPNIALAANDQIRLYFMYEAA